MKAIIKISGKQFKVNVGDTLKVARQHSEVGDTITFDHVLFANDGNQDLYGTPTVNGVTVETSVLKQGRDRKVLIYKKKRRKGYQRKKGHRQDYTLLKVENIKISSTKKSEKSKQAEAAAGVQ